jgi:predicted GH43/DUF377 family glycosyl hydrolase
VTTEALAHNTSAELYPDPARVVARLFLPGEEPHVTTSRAGAITARVLAIDETEVELLAKALLVDFGGRHRDYEKLLLRHASVVAGHVHGAELSPARTLVLGASFTAEYATEAAALCNPSAMVHPDQTGLADGQIRVAVSLRAIGEGHISSIGFCTAIVGPGPAWTFEARPLPATAGTSSPALWRREHLQAVLADQTHNNELGSAVVHALPPVFTGFDLEEVLADMHPDLLVRPDSRTIVDFLRGLVASAYEVDFPDDVELAQRILMPAAAEESNGMEDARFTRFVDEDGGVQYHATYTAYDGDRIAPRLLTSRDLRHFHAHRLAGPAARNKGMALFPRLVGGRYLALCRTDGESIGLASSPDSLVWSDPHMIHVPSLPWETVQTGNCGPPIETDRGWLVLTHGVGPMRSYAIGAMLLDLDDPTRVIGILEEPLLQPKDGERDGYVPNVVYSCGALVHDGRLWLPYGIDDARINVMWAPLEALLDAMVAR